MKVSITDHRKKLNLNQYIKLLNFFKSCNAGNSLINVPYFFHILVFEKQYVFINSPLPITKGVLPKWRVHNCITLILFTMPYHLNIEISSIISRTFAIQKDITPIVKSSGKLSKSFSLMIIRDRGIFGIPNNINNLRFFFTTS